MSRPRLLDLYCGAGGAARGYHDAGFDIVGVDIEPQPRYPYRFIRANALTFLEERNQEDWGWHGLAIDAIHASPPCQRYSSMSQCRPGLNGSYPDLIEQTRALLAASGLPYVIENVAGSPLNNPVVLCGHMFGLPLYRHRLFESTIPLRQPPHPEHTLPTSKAGHWRPGTIISVAGHCAPISMAREAMGIDWMTRDELTEAIPPQYAEYVGTALMAALKTSQTTG